MDSDSNEYESGVMIDQYASDLNLIVDKECLLAYPISGEGFCSMWAGCRANYGVDKAKVAFEINLEDYCECPDVPKCSESEPHMIRIGWSVVESSLQLGENKFSFAYCNNGKKCNDKIFEEYGETFEKGDSVASYIDFETDSNKILISYSKNGIDLGVAFEIEKTEIIKSYDIEFMHKKILNSTSEVDMDDIKKPEIVFFPHVLTKNIVFEMNFGQRVSLIGDEPFAPIKSDFLLIQKIPIEQRFCSDISIKSQTEPEAIMLVGLPGVGKTEWAIKYSKLNPSKSFCIIGMSTILNKMKNIGKKPSNTELATVKSKDDKNSNDESKIDKKDDCKTEKNESNGKSNSSHILVAKSQMELLDKVLKCMNVLIDIAAQANRNVLIDQPNIYESTRRRKIKIFEKYKCRAVVILPSYETYNEKLSTNEQISNESFTNLINDMKANFSLPEPGELFESVEYVGSVKEEAEKLVERYNKQGVENRLNLIVEKRNKKKLATKQTVSRVLGHQSVGYNKFGPRFHNSPMQVMYPNDIGYRNRFNVNPMNNKRFIGNNYYNQPIRMNGRIPTNVINPMIPGYARPSMIISNGIQSGFQNIGMPPRYNLMQPHQTPQYNLNHSWPAATSTELWNQQRMSSVTSSNSNWAPALPVSGQNHQNLMVNMIPNNSSGSQRPSWPTNNSPGNNGSVVDSWPAANQTH